MSKALPPGLRDASGGLWIDGQRIATVTPAEAAQEPRGSLLDLRRRLEAAIEQALAMLDAIDAETEDLEGHDDREPDVDDEPSLSEVEWRCEERVTKRDADGRAIELERYEGCQLSWGFSDCRDLEEQCEDEGGACEDEGGACEDEGFDSDREQDYADCG